MRFRPDLTVSIVALCAITFVASCGGGGHAPIATIPSSESLGDALNPADAEIAASSPSITPVPFSQDTFPDGTTVQSVIDTYGLTEPGRTSSRASGTRSPQPNTPQEFIKVCVADMYLQAQTILAYNSFPYAPQQSKLAYSFGQKDYAVYTPPPDGCCTNKVYGLDCSGLLYLCANYAKLGIVKGRAVKQSVASAWTVPPTWGVTMSDVTQTVAPSGAYQDGDIVFWSGHGHIGFVCGGGMNIIQSNGSDGCAKGCSVPSSSCTLTSDCQQNNNLVPGKTAGPRELALDTIITAWDFGPPSVVLRLTPSFSYAVDPAGTFLLASGDSPHLPLILNLSDMGISPGDTIKLTEFGSYFYDSTLQSTTINMIGIFSTSGEVDSYTLLNRVPGALQTSLPPMRQQFTGNGGIDTYISQAFYVPQSVGVTAIVPQGAQFIMFGAEDSYYADNTTDGYGVSIQIIASQH